MIDQKLHLSGGVGIVGHHRHVDLFAPTQPAGWVSSGSLLERLHRSRQIGRLSRSTRKNRSKRPFAKRAPGGGDNGRREVMAELFWKAVRVGNAQEHTEMRTAPICSLVESSNRR